MWLWQLLEDLLPHQFAHMVSHHVGLSTDCLGFLWTQHLVMRERDKETEKEREEWGAGMGGMPQRLVETKATVYL